MNWALVDLSAASGDSNDANSAALQRVLSRLPSSAHGELFKVMQEAAAHGNRRRLNIMQPAGDPLLVDVLPMRLAASGGAPALVVVHDPGEIDLSHDWLKSLARRNEAILRSTMDGFFVVDAECRFLDANEAFCRMVGYELPELLALRITDLEVDEHANGGVPSHTRTGMHHFPTAHRHKDGRIIYLDLSINVLHDDGVKILVGLARDVTERKRAQDELARVQRQQQLILDSAAEGIAALDQTGMVTQLNPAAANMLGCLPRHALGRSAHELFFPRQDYPSACERQVCPVCAVLKGTCGSLRAETTFYRADGTSFPVEYSITSLHERREEIGAVFVFRDVTEKHRAEAERRALEAKIQQAQRLESLGLLAGGIAHDLNNLLGGVQGHACLALSESPPGGSVAERLQRIVDACDRASKVIRQILTYSGRVTCDAAATDLNKFVESVVDFMRPAFADGISFKVRLAPQLPVVSLDAGQLQQALTSLLANAGEAIGGRGGEITLSTELLELREEDIRGRFAGQSLMPGPYVAMHIEDTGCGMAPETLERIFEPFFSGKGVGRGLGLSAMHGIVRAHRGGVRVESELGKGTRFTLVLPLKATEMRPPARPAWEPERKANSRILVVDDEDEVRSVVRDMLSFHGLQVLTARDGHGGLELFRREADSIDLVLLDLTMPGKSGMEVYREILSIRPEMRVVVMSGYSIEPQPDRFGGAAPAAFLQKPFVMNTLMETVSQALAGAPRH